VKNILVAVLLTGLATSSRAEPVTIKLGTLAPQGSSWHDLLRELGQKWEEASGGQVKLRIYPGGTQGGEGDMVRKMAVGQLQAAAISNIGMHDIAAEPQALSVPFMFQDDAQMQCAFKKVRPHIDQVLQQRGYVPVLWSTIGAVQLFCDKPHRSPADMGDAKIWAWDGDPKSVEAFRLAGLKPVVLSSSDIVSSLQTGMIDCVSNVPLYMLTTRLFERAPYMMDTTWGYVIGATLVRKDTWDKVPADVRPKLIAIAQELGARIDAEVRRMNQDAVAAMQKQGLKLTQGDAAAWRAAIEKAKPAIRGGVVSADFYDQVVAAREACK
jgi:TRAP-type C4-dicarboxylate transport system substrate-binding protein